MEVALHTEPPVCPLNHSTLELCIVTMQKKPSQGNPSVFHPSQSISTNENTSRHISYLFSKRCRRFTPIPTLTGTLLMLGSIQILMDFHSGLRYVALRTTPRRRSYLRCWGRKGSASTGWTRRCCRDPRQLPAAQSGRETLC